MSVEGSLVRYRGLYIEIVASMPPNEFDDGIRKAVRDGFWREAGKELCQTGKCWMSEEEKKKLELDLEEIRTRGKRRA